MEQTSILSICDELVKEDALAAAEDLEDLLERLTKIRKKPAKGREKTNQRLFKELAVAMALFRYCSGASVKYRQFAKILKEHGVPDAKEGDNPCLPYVKVCTPGKHRRDYHRYAQVIRIAGDKGLCPSKFYKVLKQSDGGMTGYIHKNKKGTENL